MQPAVGGLGLGGRLGIREILPEHAGAAEQHLAALVDPDLDLRRRRADGIRLDGTVGLHRDENARLGHAVELLQVEPEAAIEVEDVRSEEHTSELQSLMRSSYAVFFLKTTIYSKLSPRRRSTAHNLSTHKISHSSPSTK